MKTKLCQILAVEKSVKSKTRDVLTKTYHIFQKPDLFAGMSRKYRAKEDGVNVETFPEEYKKIQKDASVLLKQDISKALSDLFDVVATKDVANCDAKADVVVGGQTLLPQVPVTFLLFLEKELVNLHTEVSKVPTLPATENWKWDSNQNCYVTSPTETYKTKKTLKTLVKYAATEQHPAQTETYSEDVVTGTWSKIEFSSALPAEDQKNLLNKIEDLQRAVKFAREEANSREITQVKVGEKVFAYLFAK